MYIYMQFPWKSTLFLEKNAMRSLSLSAQSGRLRQLPIQALIHTAGDILRLPKDAGGCKRVFTPWFTFWLFLLQVLGSARTCRESLRHAQAWISGEREISPNTSAYCQARARLPLEYIEKAAESIQKHLQKNEGGAWLNRRVIVVDGSSVSLPDTPENQALYPQSGKQKPGCGFPSLHFTALFSLAAGAWLALAKGSRFVQERTLFRQLWNYLKEGDVALGDRGFCGFAEYWLLLQRGVDSVMRLHARRSAGCKKVRRLGKDDWLVEWIKAPHPPKWMDKETWKNMPETLLIRHVEIQVSNPGFRTQSITVATTLLDPEAYPAQDIADLYRRRWHVELFLRDIKITLGMDVLRCKTPALVHKELLFHQIAYNLVRAFMLEAARRRQEAPLRDPLRLSLTGACAAIRQWAPALCGERSRAGKIALLDTLFRCIGQDVIPLRPDRMEPRAKKRRAKQYQLLSQPRSTFKEIQHRKRYVKPLS